MYLCVESPPRPVSQEQVLSHVTLDDCDSNSADRRGILIHYFLALCVYLVQEGLPCVGVRGGVRHSIPNKPKTNHKYLIGLKISTNTYVLVIVQEFRSS